MVLLRVNKPWLGGLVASIGLLVLVLVGASIFMWKAAVVTTAVFATLSLSVVLYTLGALAERAHLDERLTMGKDAGTAYYVLQSHTADTIGVLALLSLLMVGVALGLTIYGHVQCLNSPPSSLPDLVFGVDTCNASLVTVWRRPYFASELAVYQICADDLAFTVFYYVVFGLLVLLDAAVCALTWYVAPRTTAAAEAEGLLSLEPLPPRRHAAPLDEKLRLQAALKTYEPHRRTASAAGGTVLT